MASDPHLPLAALIDSVHACEDVAITIARRVTMGSYIGDARVVAATPAAAAWYGLADPGQLIGRWISLLHHPDDAQLGRVLSAARHYGYTVPTAYVSRIRQGATDRFRPVMKHTTQMEYESETYWITRLSAPQGPPLADQHEVWQHFTLPDAEAARQFYGQMSVADIDRTLQRPGLSEATAAAPEVHGRGARASDATTPARGHGQVVSRRRPEQTLGPLLQHAREAQGLSLRQAAARIYREDGQPISASYLHDLEHDRRKPSPHLLRELAGVLQIPHDRLLTTARQADAILRAYLDEIPEAEAALSWLLLLARQYHFAAWERVARQLLSQR